MTMTPFSCCHTHSKLVLTQILRHYRGTFKLVICKTQIQDEPNKNMRRMIVSIFLPLLEA